MEEKKTEGLLLQAIPYLGNQKILKVLTSDRGLLSLFVKKKELISLANPFLRGEWVITASNGDMHLVKDISIQNHFNELRSSFARIQVAGQIAQAILLSQYPGKSSHGIFALCNAYFEKLPLFDHPETLLASFYLKTLLHDGLLALDDACVECGQKAAYIGIDGSHCENHQKPNSFFFSSDDLTKIHILTFARKFQPLQNLTLSKEIQKQIVQFFSFLISN